ncbi:ATP-dependent RNA helicase [Lachnellula subtilissima]|uniref:RNA helicase n=1 Tax=Lachnellula subtilissima TaxID=602034 RepID=A0A8H8U4U4_9HELO|nr:ATP-dependent RNA helicase [Lachnellula subtilissima]
MSWQSTKDLAAALPDASSTGWGTDTNAAPAADGWGADASGDTAVDVEEAPRPSYTPAGITKTPGELGWADNKNAAYDYATFSKSNKQLADEKAARGEAEGQTPGDGQDPEAEPVGAVGGLASGEWASGAVVYEWREEYGEVGPRFANLEKQLFGSELHVRAGIEFKEISELQVHQEGNINLNPVRKFEDAGLHPVMLENVKLAGYTVPTPIQQYTLPAVLKGHDIVACAQTGSGKTAAFLIPILSKLMGKAKKLAAPRPNPATFISGTHAPVRAEPLVLIVCPTRELATQIFDEARRFCYRSMLRPCVIYGGGPISEQFIQLQKGCDVLIATPGRLCDFINRPTILTLKRLKYMVIDEADEMLTSDWDVELNQIMSGGDQEDGNINYLMFSATFPKIAQQLATEHLAPNHVRVRVGRAGSSHKNIKQDIVYVEPAMKQQALWDLLMSGKAARTIIFVNSKRTADEVDDFLFNKDLPCTSIHGDRTQREREDSIRAFRMGKAPVLIATGVSARGLDIHFVAHVINYDLPSSNHGGIEDYIHRIGRTGRIGNLGLATSFYNERDADLAEPLVKVLLETGQGIPDFLAEHIPEGFEDGKGDVSKLVFEPLEEEFNVADPADPGWGVTEPTPVHSGWGLPSLADLTPATAAPTTTGWGAPPPAPTLAKATMVPGGWNSEVPPSSSGAAW